MTNLRRTSARAVFRLCCALAASGLTLFIAVAPASASETIESFSTTPSTTQAGGHPDLQTSFRLASPGQPEAVQNAAINMAHGVFGNPNAVTLCRSLDFALDRCPAASQVGLITLHANYLGDPNYLLGTAPLFGMVPQAESETARFAFVAPTLGIPISIPIAVRTSTDYGLRLTVSGITQTAPLAAADITIWGFPALKSHDAQRFAKGSPGAPAGCPGLADASCIVTPTPAGIAVNPLTDNPTNCSGAALHTSLDVQTYQDPVSSHAESPYPATTGCGAETFQPVLRTKPTTVETDSASGLDLELSAPQFEGFAVSPSQIRSAIVTFPAGFTINPDAADGQTACPDALANFDSEGPAGCPDSSKIGTFSIGTVALGGPLQGAVYFGQPKPGDQYRLFLIVSGFGINAKLVGSVHPDPATGRLTTTLTDLPQVPFDSFDLHLFASDRGLVATPTRCTTYNTESLFVPWNESLPSQSSSPSFALDSGPHGAPCPAALRPFKPRLIAGTSNGKAGTFSSFSLKLDREDGDQYLGKLNFSMPPGLTADLRGVAYCPEAAIAIAANTLGAAERAAPSCPAGSEIGTSNVAAGPGSHPFHAVGKIYLAGPFQGAPLSLVAITPALAGPYDYGTVVVRVALHVDQADAHVIADSETVPSIIGGVPLRLRSIQVNIDRPSFMINPTNCSPFQIGSEGIGDQGTAASFSSPFTAVNCSTLGFAPKMKITQLGGHKATARNQDPSLRFDLNTRSGDANLKSVAVTLPKAFEIDQRHLGNICSKTELAASHCSGRQAIGTVSTETPLLEKPLTGPAYAVSGFGKLPHVAFILAGQVTLIPEAKSSSVEGGHLKTVVPTIPDAPVGHFRLTLFGGKQGYLINTRSLCAAPAVTTVEYTGQNGKTATQHVKAKTACSAAKAKKSKRHH